jgi:hypothetical protein
MAGTFPVLAVAVGVTLAGLAEGASLGFAQWLVLRHHLPGVRRRDWVLYTTVAAGIAYVLGMTPSTLYDLFALSTPGMIGITVVLGLLLVPSIGFAQWLVLRRHLPRAGWWVLANAFAWTFGVAIPFVVLMLVPDESPMGAFIAAGVASGLLMGAVVGAITGVALIRLLKER